MSSRRSSNSKRRRESFMVLESPSSKRTRQSLLAAAEDEHLEQGGNDVPLGRKASMSGLKSPAIKGIGNLQSPAQRSTSAKKKKVQKNLVFEADHEDDQAILQQKWTYEAHNILVNKQNNSKSDSNDVPSRVSPTPSTPQTTKVPASSSSIRKSIGGFLSTPLPSTPMIPSSILKTPLKLKRHRQLSLVKFLFFIVIIVLVEQKFQAYFGYNRSSKTTQKAKTQTAPKKFNYDNLLRNLENRVDNVMDKVQTYSLNDLCSGETTSNAAEENIIEVSKDLEKIDRELDNLNRTLQVAKAKAISFEKNDVNYMIEIKNIKSILSHITEGMHATDKVLSETTDLLVSLSK